MQSSMWKFIITMATPTKPLAAPGKPFPTLCISQNDWSFLLPILPRKVDF
jgi:hypothetical protein